MRSSGSLEKDDISVNIIKQAQSELEPALLHMVNSTIKTTTFPQSLKTTKVIPIRKPGKDITSSDGWRPVNVVHICPGKDNRMSLLGSTSTTPGK